MAAAAIPFIIQGLQLLPGLIDPAAKIIEIARQDPSPETQAKLAELSARLRASVAEVEAVPLPNKRPS